MQSNSLLLAWGLFLVSAFYACEHFLISPDWAVTASYFEISHLGSYAAGLLLGWTAFGPRGWFGWFAQHPKLVLGGFLLGAILLVVLRKVCQCEGSLLPFLDTGKFFLGIVVGSVLVSRGVTPLPKA